MLERTWVEFGHFLITWAFIHVIAFGSRALILKYYRRRRNHDGSSIARSR